MRSYRGGRGLALAVPLIAAMAAPVYAQNRVELYELKRDGEILAECSVETGGKITGCNDYRNEGWHSVVANGDLLSPVVIGDKQFVICESASDGCIYPGSPLYRYLIGVHHDLAGEVVRAGNLVK